MVSRTAPILIFSASFFLIIGLDLLNIPIKNLQQLAAVILVLLLLFARRFFNNPKRKIGPVNLKWLMLFLANSLIYVLLLSSGGFYSPFLVLIHLFTLGIGFLISIREAMIFLFLSIVALLLNLQLDPVISGNFQEDPWSVILYIISFIAVLPLIHQLIEEYHMGEKIVGFLEEKMHFEEKKKETIFQELDEMVIVLNKKMQILSINHVTRTILQKSNAEIVFNHFFELFNIKDHSGSPVKEDSISFSKVAEKKDVVVKNGYYLSAPGLVQPVKVDLHLRPVIGATQEVEQVVLVIKESSKTSSQIEKSTAIQDSLHFLHDRLKRLEFDLSRTGEGATYQLEAFLMQKTVQDIAQLEILLDHPLDESRKFTDLLNICHDSVDELAHAAELLEVSFTFDKHGQKEVSEKPVQPHNEPVIELSENVHGEYTGVVDPGWFKTALDRLLFLASMLASNEEDKVVTVALETSQEAVKIQISVITNCAISKFQELFIFNYGSLANEECLKRGSGIEGLLARLILDQTTANLSMRQDLANTLIFEVTVPRGSLK